MEEEEEEGESEADAHERLKTSLTEAFEQQTASLSALKVLCISTYSWSV